MAASDTQEGAASVAGLAAREYAPEMHRLLVAAGEQTASDDAPVAPGASDEEEEGEEGEEEAPESLRELESAGGQSASDHAPVAPAAAEDEDEDGGGAVEADQDDAPEPYDEHECEEGGKEEDGGDATERDEEGEDVDAETHLPSAPTDEEVRGKQHHSNINCLSTPRKRIVSLALLLLIMMGWTVLTTSSASPTCEVTSLATNVRLFCTANQPSPSCCESLRAAAMSHGRHRCLCLVGSSPDVLMIGFSAENLVSLYGQCTDHDNGFSCEGAVTDETDRGERMPRHGRQHDKDDAQEEVTDETDRGEHMPRHGKEADKDEPQEEDQRSHRERIRRHGRRHDFEDDWHGKDEPQQVTEIHGSEQDEDQQKEAGHPKKQQSEISSTHEQSYDYEYQPRSDSGSGIATVACLIVLAVAVLLGGGVALRYKHRHGINIRHLLHLAAAAALPVFATQARLAAPVDLPLEQPTPAAPALVDGVPGAHVQETRLAFFPGPVEVVSLVLYILLDKMRRSLRA